MLRRLEGGPGGCPNCGCEAAVRRGRVVRFGQKRQRWECDSCGRIYTAPVEEPEVIRIAKECYAVDYPILRCPQCESRRVPAYSTDRPIRYHRCAECGYRFKSIEKEVPA